MGVSLPSSSTLSSQGQRSQLPGLGGGVGMLPSLLPRQQQHPLGTMSLAVDEEFSGSRRPPSSAGSLFPMGSLPLQTPVSHLFEGGFKYEVHTLFVGGRSLCQV